MIHKSLLAAIALFILPTGCSEEEDIKAATNPPDPVPVSSELNAEVVVSGLSQPVFAGAPSGDNNRLFVVEKAGQIRIVRDNTLAPTPFLDITDRVEASAGERGLLGLAFAPEYITNGFFYVNYTDQSGRTIISRFSVTSNPDLANASSEQIILTVDQPFANHNAGMLAFSPIDGYLYIGLGDGGSGGDPQNNAQNPSTLLGKMLRIDVSGGLPYTVPADNPYVNSPDTLNEIWSFGLRNPWRYSFDRVTGALYIGDVGQNSTEEIDFSPATSTGRENYGWRLKEGSDCFNPSQGCESGVNLTDPIHEYSHSDPSSPCSVTGGYVYRGAAMPLLSGTYFFADFCSGQVWSFRYDNGTKTEFQDRTAELGLPQIPIASFGEDADGELYIVDFSGTVYKIVPRPGSSVTADM